MLSPISGRCSEVSNAWPRVMNCLPASQHVRIGSLAEVGRSLGNVCGDRKRPKLERYGAKHAMPCDYRALDVRLPPKAEIGGPTYIRPGTPVISSPAPANF